MPSKKRRANRARKALVKRQMLAASALSGTEQSLSISPQTIKQVRDEWIQDLTAEDHMTECGLEYEMRVIRVSDIDHELSLRNNARIGETRLDSVVMDYALMRLDGDRFPATVVSSAPSTSKKLWVTASGNQRTASVIETEDEFILAYVITTDDPLAVDRFARSINRKEGARQTADEAVQHAVWILENDEDATVQSVGMDLGINPNTIRQHKVAAELRRDLEAAGVGAERMNKRILTKLRTLRHTQKVMLAVAEAVSKYALSGPLVIELVDLIRVQDDEQSQLDMLQTWIARHTSATKTKKTRGRTKATKAELFRHYFGTLHGFLTRGTTSGKAFTKPSQVRMSSAAELARYTEESKEVIRILNDLFDLGVEL